MIIDTTYLLPLSRIDIDTDLLKAIDEGKVNLDLYSIKINMISIFELQAKAAKTKIPTNFTAEAIDAINTIFKVEPFYNPEIMKISYSLLEYLKDYIDCIIVATAVVSGEDLITEDSRINYNKKFIKDKYKIDITNYKELIMAGN